MLGAARAGFLGAAGAGPAYTYSTMSSILRDVRIVLSNGNLRVTKTGDLFRGWSYGVSSMKKSSGKWYVEATWVQSNSAGFCLVGICGESIAQEANDSNTDSEAFWNAGESGVGYTSNATIGEDGGTVAYGSTYAVGDVIGIALDVDNDQVTFYKNGVSQGVHSLVNTEAEYRIGIAPGFEAGDDAIVDMNFGATPFAYSVPGGYNAGLYE